MPKDIPASDYTPREMAYPYAYQVSASVRYETGETETVYSAILASWEPLERQEVLVNGESNIRAVINGKYRRRIDELSDLKIARLWIDRSK